MPGKATSGRAEGNRRSRLIWDRFVSADPETHGSAGRCAQARGPGTARRRRRRPASWPGWPGGRSGWAAVRCLVRRKGSASFSSPSTPCGRMRSAPTASPTRGRRGWTGWPPRASASTDAHAHNVVTLPSHANILSGRYPLEHGVRDNAGFRFPPGMDTLATLLKARGYATGAFVSAFPLDCPVRADTGVRRLRGQLRGRAGPAGLPGAGAARERRRWPSRAGGWTPRATGPSSAGFTSTSRMRPIGRRRALAARFADRPYQGEVAAADAALGPLLEPLLASGRDGRTLVVLTADHGESLGEHGEATHGIFAYEATLRVPLVVYRAAPRLAAGRARARAPRRPPAHDPGRARRARAGRAARPQISSPAAPAPKPTRDVFRGLVGRARTAAGRRSTA